MNDELNPAVRYGQRLEKAIKNSGLSVRGLAKKMQPESHESARTSLHKYLRGEHMPGLRRRIEFAEALSDPSLIATGEDEDEEAQLARDLMSVVRAVMRQSEATHSLRGDPNHDLVGSQKAPRSPVTGTDA